MALSRGAVGTTCGTAENGDWSFKAHFLDDNFALAFATYLRNLNPEKCEVSYHDVKGGGPPRIRGIVTDYLRKAERQDPPRFP